MNKYIEDLDRKLTYENIEKLLGNKLGVINKIEAMSNYHDLPHIFRFRAFRNPLIDGTGNEISPSISEGYGFKQNELHSKIAAICEVIERYCATFENDHEIFTECFNNIHEAAVNPEVITRFLSEQYEQENFLFKDVNKNTVLPWVKGFSLQFNQPIWIPADLIYLVQPSNPHPIRDYTSNGLACGTSFWHATYSAICELVERDAFVLTWLLKRSAPRINHRSIHDKAIQDMIEKYERYGYQIIINDISINTVVPTFLITALSNDSWPHVAVAAKADLNPLLAIRGAIEELTGVISGLRDDREYITDFSKENLGSHAFFYTEGTRTNLLDFYLNAEKIDLPEEEVINTTYKDAVSSIIGKLSQENINIYVVDLTTPDIIDAGLSVVRAVSPELQSLYISEPYLQSERLWRIGKDLGITTTQEINFEVNPFS